MKRAVLLSLIYSVPIILFSIIYIALLYAPVFFSYILGILIATILYIFTEQLATHSAAEFENRFWTLVAFNLAVACAFCPDSPVRFSPGNANLAWTLVLFFTFFAHNYDRHLRRIFLQQLPNIKRIQSSTFRDDQRIAAKEKITELRRLLRSIDLIWLSSAIQNLILLPRVLYIERQIIKIFEDATTEELNLIMNSIELGLIFYKMKDHRIARQFNRTKLLQILAIQRIQDLNLISKALLLDGFQRMKLSAHPMSEHYVKNIIMKTSGDELSELKSLTDAKGDINSLHKLIYQDIHSNVIKEEIIVYITRQANIQAAHNIIGSKIGKKRQKFAWRKILSDVDDTLSSSGGSWPAGIDTSYPKKAIYPGVLAFYRELDLGLSGTDEEWDDSNRVGNLVFVSARPHVYKDLSESVSFEKFKWLQQTRGMHTSPSLLAGNLDTGTKFMLGGIMEPIALKKYINFCEYLALYPEFQCIFVGDNGQGDVRTAEMIFDTPKFNKNIERVYIHKVQPIHLTHTMHLSTKSPWLSSTSTTHYAHKCRIFYFTTYIEAAIDAYDHKLIRLSGLRRIMVESKIDFLSISLSHWSLGLTSINEGANKREARQREINQSLSIGNTRLLKENIALVSLLSFDCRFPTGTAVKTKFGSGIVEHFRWLDGIYEVSLLYQLNGKPLMKVYMIGEELTLITQKGARGLLTTIAPLPPSYNMTNTTTLPSATSTSSTSLIIPRKSSSSGMTLNNSNNNQSKIKGKQPISQVIVGAQIWTPYGIGIVLYHRPSDDVIVAKLSGWVATCYLQRKCIVQLSQPVALATTPPSSPRSSNILKHGFSSPSSNTPTLLANSARLPSLLPQWLGLSRTWTSSNNKPITTLSSAIASVTTASTSASHIELNAELISGVKLITLFGKATLVRILDRKPSILVEVDFDWVLANGRKAKGYLSLNSIKEANDNTAMSPTRESLRLLRRSSTNSIPTNSNKQPNTTAIVTDNSVPSTPLSKSHRLHPTFQQTNNSNNSNSWLTSPSSWLLSSSSSSTMTHINANNSQTNIMTTAIMNTSTPPIHSSIPLNKATPFLISTNHHIDTINANNINRILPFPLANNTSITTQIISDNSNNNTTKEYEYQISDYCIIKPFGICQIINKYNKSNHDITVFICKSIIPSLQYMKLYITLSSQQLQPIKQLFAINQIIVTKYGIIGIIENIRPNGMLVIQTTWCTMYINPTCILKTIPFYIGQTVNTPYGTGTILSYRVQDEMYAISLQRHHQHKKQQQGGDQGTTLGILYCHDTACIQPAVVIQHQESITTGAGAGTGTMLCAHHDINGYIAQHDCHNTTTFDIFNIRSWMK